jgi:hypothetical protein
VLVGYGFSHSVCLCDSPRKVRTTNNKNTEKSEKGQHSIQTFLKTPGNTNKQNVRNHTSPTPTERLHDRNSEVEEASLVEAFVDLFLFVIVTSTSTCDCLFVFLPLFHHLAHHLFLHDVETIPSVLLPQLLKHQATQTNRM